MRDTWRLKSNPLSYLRGRQVNFNLQAPQPNTRPLLAPDGSPRLGEGGRVMGQPYASPVPSQMSSPLYDLFTAGRAPGTYEFPSGISFVAEMTAGGHILNLKMADPGVSTGVRVLPWGPNACTYMQLDGAADAWFTGPLSGCNVYAAGDGVDPWVFHANSNENAADLARNNSAKRTAALNAAASFGQCKPLWGHLERGARFYASGLGFVFGVRKSQRWFNYFHDGQGTVTQLS